MRRVSVERVVLFDGVCNLCNGLVQFIIRRDPHARFRFAPMTSFAADTIVLLEDGRKYERSAAVLRIARRLRAPWPVLFAFIVVPRPLRDWAYDARRSSSLPLVWPPRDVHGPDAGVARAFRGVS